MTETPPLMRTPWCDSFLGKKVDMNLAGQRGWQAPVLSRNFPLSLKAKNGSSILIKKFEPSFQCGSHAIYFWIIMGLEEHGRIESLEYLPVQSFENGNVTHKHMELFPTDEELFGEEIDRVLC
ncbi:MAG: hypothetical protein EOM25_08715 [Deltaproteobacteria bacterium]|nr:hypothetical protein [Deltaproteobacteria bacterium]